MRYGTWKTRLPALAPRLVEAIGMIRAVTPRACLRTRYGDWLRTCGGVRRL